MKNCTFPVRSGRGKCYLCKDLFSNNPQRFYFIMKRIILLLVSLLPVLSAFSQKEKRPYTAKGTDSVNHSFL